MGDALYTWMALLITFTVGYVVGRHAASPVTYHVHVPSGPGPEGGER